MNRRLPCPFKAVLHVIFLDDFLYMHLHIIERRDTVINQCKGRKGVHAFTCSSMSLFSLWPSLIGWCATVARSGYSKINCFSSLHLFQLRWNWVVLCSQLVRDKMDVRFYIEGLSVVFYIGGDFYIIQPIQIFFLCRYSLTTGKIFDLINEV